MSVEQKVERNGWAIRVGPAGTRSTSAVSIGTKFSYEELMAPASLLSQVAA